MSKYNKYLNLQYILERKGNCNKYNEPLPFKCRACYFHRPNPYFRCDKPFAGGIDEANEAIFKACKQILIDEQFEKTVLK